IPRLAPGLGSIDPVDLLEHSAGERMDRALGLRAGALGDEASHADATKEVLCQDTPGGVAGAEEKYGNRRGAIGHPRSREFWVASLYGCEMAHRRPWRDSLAAGC